ncbi:MAG: TetR/AcrR family transcriptional regulator [Flavobacteriales bacterium]|nr:TetR/AcrR family transcriptional regulator [Flavobacteriales bacterium]
MGTRILTMGIDLMLELGLEAFTFKKLAERMGSTELTVYHYFANKQRLLQYYFQLYWLWLQTYCMQEGRSLKDPRTRLHGDIKALWDLAGGCHGRADRSGEAPGIGHRRRLEILPA